MEKYKSHIIFLSLLLVFIVIFYYIGKIILPFIIGLFFAYALKPLIKKIQKFIPNRNLAVTFLLLLTVVVSIGFVWLFGNQVVNDFKQLNNAFLIFAENNSDEIDKTTNKIKSYIEKIYPKKDLEKQLGKESKMDSLDFNSETIKESLSNITSFLGSNEKDENSKHNLNWFLIFIYSMGYFIFIIYTYNYFENSFEKYFGGEKKRNKYFEGIKDDFNNTFSTYFRQRSKIVVISTFIFITSFFIIGIPGAIIFGLIAGFLCYISHFHYLALIPLSLSCWALSIQQNHGFFLYFGLVLSIFIIVSVLEELLFFPKIMKGVSSMNPAIMMVSLSVWSYIFGTIGLLIALPLTTVLLVYLDRILLQRREKLETQ